MAIGVNVKESVVMSEDLGSKQVVGTIHKSARFMLFTTTPNAQWAADRIIQENAYPFADVVIETNRKLFRYMPGDVFRLTYARYSENLILRVLNIQEEDLLSGKIIVSCIEDPRYAGQLIPADTMDIPVGEGDEGPTQFPLEPLDNFTIKEAPYVLVGDEIKIITLVGREKGYEVGYALYMSIDDGASFAKIQDATSFAVHGTLASAYTDQTNIIDDDVGFDVIIETDADAIQSVTRDQLFTATNLAVIHNEIVTFQTITPYGSDNKYKIEGIYRMRWGTDQVHHSVGEDFYFIGGGRYEILTNVEFVLGAQIYFKVVPYSGYTISAIEYAMPKYIELAGTAREPYDPCNLIANGVALDPTYSTNIDLAWNPRVRGDGAGLENPDYYTDAENTWEGLFEVQVWVSSSLVRTITGIDNDHYVYTEAMNLIDNGSLAGSIEFWLRNYIDVSGQTYYSAWVKRTVTKI